MNESRSYQIGANNSATIVLTEALPANEVAADPEGAESDPVISIELATDSEMIEGDIAEFSISASEISTDNLEIRIDVNEGETDFFDLGEFIPVTLFAGETSISIQIASVDDEVAETAEGELILSIGEGEGYQIGEQNQISIYVNDDEGGLGTDIASESEQDSEPSTNWTRTFNFIFE